MNMHEIKTITTEEEYDAALEAIRPYFDNEPEAGTPESANFEGLALLIGNYEDKHYPIPEAEPVEVLKFVMDQNGYTQKDLSVVLGHRSRASEILNEKRPLTLDHIRALYAAWRIPPAALIGRLEQDRAQA